MRVTIQQLHTSRYISQHGLVTKWSQISMLARLRFSVEKTIILTGFEPFAGATLNSSEMLINNIRLQNFDGINLVTEVLPVEYSAATSRLLSLIQQHQPDVVIATGQAEGRNEISIERIAVNLADAKLPDNSGVTLINQPITTIGVKEIPSTLPIDEIIAAIKDVGVAASESHSAGRFVCNYVFYQLQSALIDSQISSGFIHLPLAIEQQDEFPDKPTMSVDDIVKGISAAINQLRNFI